jgi:hypothetical protein
MVAQPQQAPPPNIRALPPPPVAGPGAQPRNYRPQPTEPADPDQYDLGQIAQDRSQILITQIDFWENVIVTIDRLARRKSDPANPYLQIGALVPTQFTHPLISDFLNKGIPYLLSKGVAIHFPPDKNPSASNHNLSVAARLVRKTWELNNKQGRGSLMRRAKMIGARGGYSMLYDYPEQQTAQQISGGYPICSWLVDPLDVQVVRDYERRLKRVIWARQSLVANLPKELRGSHENPDEIVDVYEHWDRVNYGCVLNGTDIVKPLTAHGFVDRQGQNMIPWVHVLHDEGEYVRGDSDPTVTAITLLKTIVGHPPAEHLIDACQHLSFMLTLLRFCVTNGVLPEKEIKGAFTYDPGRRTYQFEEGNPADGVQIVDTAKNLPAILSVVQYFQSLGEQSGMGSNMLSGMKQEISGTSAQEQTDLGRAPLDAVRDTLERGLAEEAEMILAIATSNTSPSTAQRWQNKFGSPLPAQRADDPHYTDGQSLPQSDQIVGQPGAQLSWLDFEGCDEAVCTVNSAADLPIEQSYQIGTTLLTNPNSPFDPVEILQTFFKLDNAQDAYQRGLLAKMYANPQLPFADLLALKELVQQKQGEMDPQILATLDAQITQAEQVALQNVVQQKLSAIMQGMNPGSTNPTANANGPPQPGATPPGGPSPPGAANGPPQGLGPNAPVGTMPPQPQHTPIAGMASGAPPPPPPTGQAMPAPYPTVGIGSPTVGRGG